MFQLISLTFNNIRCFVEEQTITFTELEKLVQIDGANENTGGSSGSGKSTILLALDYLLGVCDIPSTNLQSRLTKESMYVKGVFVINGTTVVIERSKKNGTTITSPDETISNNAALAEEKIDELIGIPRKIFRRMIHKKQGEGGFFLEMTAQKRYEFLVQVLELDTHIEKTNTITVDIVGFEKELETLKARIASNSTQIAELQELLKNKVAPTCEVSDEQIKALRDRIAQDEDWISNQNRWLSDETAKLQTPNIIKYNNDRSQLHDIEKSVLALKAKISGYDTAKERLNKTMMQIENARTQAGTVGLKIKELKSQKESVEQSICYTCAQGWVTKSAQVKIKTLSDQITDNIAEALQLKTLIDTEQDVKDNLVRLAEIKAKTEEEKVALEGKAVQENIRLHNLETEAENTNLKAKAEYTEKMNELRTVYDSQTSEVEIRISENKNKLATAEATLKSHNSEKNKFNKEVSDLSKMIASKQLIQSEKEKAAEVLEKKSIPVAQESKRLIKTYVLQIFQETLDLIGDTATEFLSVIPNMANATIYFEGCKETQKGTLKDEVTAVINMNGDNAIPIKSLSGGEHTTVDLAVDLSVIDVIEVKTGKGADFFALDEPFDGLDSVCKEHCLEMIKQIDTKKRIIMVDHSPELKEMVSEVITAIKSGETSRIAS